MKGVKRFGQSKKLSPRYIGPFPITEQVGEVAYRVQLPDSLLGVHNVFHVSMLRKCLREPMEYLDMIGTVLQDDLTYEEYLDVKDRET